MVDQKLLISEEYSTLVWFLFPSEVLEDLLELKQNQSLSIDDLNSFNNTFKSKYQTEWTTPFMPRDYNRGKHKFEFSEEYYET